MVARSHPRGRAAGAFGDAIVVLQTHAILAILSPDAILEVFRRSGVRLCTRQSMSSSVANSVRREAQAVMAAISSACTASAR